MREDRQPNELTLAGAARLIQERTLSPVELVHRCLERIEEMQTRFHAFISVQPEDALGQARQAQTELAAGRYRGPLHGIPIAVKDNIDVAGIATTAGSPIFAAAGVATTDAEVVRRLREAGAVVIGKTNLHEFACGTTGCNPHYGAVANPGDQTRVSGGSSSGSAVAVATGMALAALGTDTGGSIRIPAAFCGVLGLKPTYGSISTAGIVPLSWSLDHAGPICRTAEDAALTMGALMGYPADPTQRYQWPLPGGPGSLAGVRVGVPSDFFFAGVDAEIEAAVRQAIRLLADMGAELREVSLPLLDEATRASSTILLSEALAYHERWLAERPEDYGQDVRLRLESARAHTAVDYIRARRLQADMVERWQDVFREIDVLAAPVTAESPALIEAAWGPAPPSYVRLTNPFNLSGQPALSVPCGFTAGGLPIGLQLAGRWREEDFLLRVAHAYEQAALS